jgi:hypothetical protein
MLTRRLARLAAALLAAGFLLSTVASGADPTPRIRISFAHGLKTRSAPNDVRVRIHGVIRANGRGVRHALITIAEPTPGAPTVSVGTTKSDRRGLFAFSVPPGGTRTVVALFQTFVSNYLQINQATHIFLRAPRHVRSGGRVTFRGHVRDLGGAIVLVELQVRKVRHVYQTFRVVRTKPDGTFTGRFHFAHGRAQYGFRAIVERQAAFPFARSKSQVLLVRVG